MVESRLKQRDASILSHFKRYAVGNQKWTPVQHLRRHPCCDMAHGSL